MTYTILTVKAGEESKSLESCGYLWGELSNLKMDRNGLLINLGGGMITDLGGFVASTFKRGIDFMNIPTSLLAMTDAAIGGKCGIDFLQFKNQIGLFRTACLTVVFPDFLETLNEVEKKSGLAESIKHALIIDVDFFHEINDKLRNSNILYKEIIRKSIELKTAIVTEDPLEQHQRKKLNFGHTIGHALESYFLEQKSTIPHGFAVAAGMVCESYISMKLGLLQEEDFESIVQLTQPLYALPLVEVDSINNVVKYIANDKKNINQKHQFTLLNGIGDALINQKVSEELIVESLTYYCNSQ
jgi:3-dehydroquinate synthase